MPTLARVIAELIALEGPLPVDRYMALCLGHPTLGYYTTRDPFGAAGDFTTAPEISQIFGELLGLWTGQVWIDMGAPAALRLVEIGPGRGTLMADALRAIARALPAMIAALDIHMVETSPVLRRSQQAALARSGRQATWHESVEQALEGPAIVIANELLDALPVKQFVMTATGWHERLVGLGADGALAFGLAAEPDPAINARMPEGAVIELPLVSDALVRTIAAHLATAGGAALFIDYGSSVPGAGDTLQAVSRHAFADPLLRPGEVDLTTQVDFSRVAAVARAAGAAVHGPATQADFLLALGLAQRAAALRRNATAAQAAAIDAALERLTAMGERGMGELFKALCIAHPAQPAPPGFASPAPPAPARD